jgi:hypothetical protein
VSNARDQQIVETIADSVTNLKADQVSSSLAMETDRSSSDPAFRGLLSEIARLSPVRVSTFEREGLDGHTARSQ